MSSNNEELVSGSTIPELGGLPNSLLEKASAIEQTIVVQAQNERAITEMRDIASVVCHGMEVVDDGLYLEAEGARGLERIGQFFLPRHRLMTSISSPHDASTLVGAFRTAGFFDEVALIGQEYKDQDLTLKNDFIEDSKHIASQREELSNKTFKLSVQTGNTIEHDQVTGLRDRFVHEVARSGADFQKQLIGSAYWQLLMYLRRDDAQDLLKNYREQARTAKWDLFKSASVFETPEEQALCISIGLYNTRTEASRDALSTAFSKYLTTTEQNRVRRMIGRQKKDPMADAGGLHIWCLVEGGYLAEVSKLRDVVETKSEEYNDALSYFEANTQISTVVQLINQYEKLMDCVIGEVDPGSVITLLELETWLANQVLSIDAGLRRNHGADFAKYYRRVISRSRLNQITLKPLHNQVRDLTSPQQSHDAAVTDSKWDWRSELEAIGKDYTVSAAELRRGDPGFGLVQFLMGRGMEKETAKQHLGFLLAIRANLIKDNDADVCFNNLLRAIGNEADIAERAGHMLNGGSLYKLTEWMASLEEDSILFDRLPGFLQNAVNSFASFKSRILETNSLTDPALEHEEAQGSAESNEDSKSDTKLPIDLVNQFERLNFEIFPPGVGLEQIREGLGRQLSEEILSLIDWGRIEALIGWRDKFAQDGGDSISTRLYRSKPGTLKVRFPHFVLEIDVIDARGEVARVVVAEVPVEDNGTYIYREQEGYPWPEVFKGFKKEARVYGALMVPHDNKKRANGSHSSRVEAALMSELTAI